MKTLLIGLFALGTSTSAFAACGELWVEHINASMPSVIQVPYRNTVVTTTSSDAKLISTGVDSDTFSYKVTIETTGYTPTTLAIEATVSNAKPETIFEKLCSKILNSKVERISE